MVVPMVQPIELSSISIYDRWRVLLMGLSNHRFCDSSCTFSRYHHSLNCFESVFDTCLVVRNQGIKMEEMLIYMYYQIYLRTLCVPILGEDLWLVVVDSVVVIVL